MNSTPRRYELIIFDWDGTLRDSVGTIVGCAQAALDELGLPSDPEAIRQTVGLGLDEAIPRWSPGLDRQNVSKVRQRYSYHWIHDWNDRAEFFAGVPDLLSRLADRGLLLAVATGKGRRGLRVDMQRSGVEDRFVASRTSDDCAAKPAPQMVLEILDELGVRAQQALVVGDTTHDLQMAANAGVDALGVAGGAMSEAALRPLALDCLDHVCQLDSWLDQLSSCA